MTTGVSQAEVTLSNKALIELIKGVHEKGAVFKFKASGSSMYPMIRSDDIITVSPQRHFSPGPGMVAAFLHPDSGKLVVHRIKKMRRGSLLCQGDNSPEPDGWISRESLMGMISGVERTGKPVFWPYRNRYFSGFFYRIMRIAYFFSRAARYIFNSLSGRRSG